MTILIAGGAGYIGSHTCIKLLESDQDIVIVDNLCNSHKAVISRIHEITRKDFTFYCVDLREEIMLDEIFRKHDISSVIHFAGYKAVSESVHMPLKYYRNNIISTLSLLKAMAAHQIKNLVFSSSATVYGNPAAVPITEDCPLSATSPYGMTKLMIETILTDLQHSDPSWNIALLRYFNPVGAHPSGLIGEDPEGTPNNLIPYITQVAIGKLDKVKVYGNDYLTRDGTGIRDYIHVDDLAEGHLSALAKLKTNCGAVIYNLGTGIGYSVMDVIEMFSKVTGRPIPYEVADRRSGDVAECFSDPGKARRELSWTAKRGLHEMCADAWNWQLKNPNGYESK